jgi:hypothetical protein
MHLILLGGCLSLFMVMGITTYKSEAQVVVTGKTNVPSGQIIAPFDTRDGRDTWIQLTNTAATPVAIHVQVLLGSTCFERDFFDTLTPLDTVIYQMSDLKLNPVPGSDAGSSPIAPDTVNTMGVVTFTPVVAANIDNNQPISHNHLHGVVHWENALSASDPDVGDTDVLYTWNAMGRDAVLANGVRAADGVVLDGAAAFFELIQPNIFHIHYTDDFDANAEQVMFSDLIMVAINDNYQGGYTPSAGTTPTLAVDVFDNNENFSSCGSQTFTCKEVIGLNNLHPTTRVLRSTGASGVTLDGDDSGPTLRAACLADRLAGPPPAGDVTDNDCRVACPSIGAEHRAQQ